MEHTEPSRFGASERPTEAAGTDPAGGDSAIAESPGATRNDGSAPRANGAAEPVLFRFFNEIGTIDQLAMNRFEAVMPHRMSLAQFSVLNHFVRLGGERSLVQLARSFQVTKPAMTKLIRKLEEAGFVQVRPNPADSRSKLVSITERGVSARHQAIMALAPSFGEMRRAIGEEAFEQALPFLMRLREWLDKGR